MHGDEDDDEKGKKEQPFEEFMATSNPQAYGNPIPDVVPRIINIFSAARRDGRTLRVSAPMVRYSKLPFRLLVREYGVDICYTPMMLAHEFVRSSIARESDFSTCGIERQPTEDGREHALIAQFASADPVEFARAAAMVAPWVDGVDLNCGCPQSWAMKEGIGCSLMEHPDLVADMVRAAKASIGSGKSVSVKIRIRKDLARTLEWVRKVELGGVDFVTVHGRTRSQRSSTPPDYDAIRQVKECVRVPIIANGDAYTLADTDKIACLTKADGVMFARGILENPAAAAGFNVTPVDCVLTFVEHAVRCPIPFALILHHVSDMTAHMEGMTKTERRRLMACEDLLDLIDYMDERWGLHAGCETIPNNHT